MRRKRLSIRQRFRKMLDRALTNSSVLQFAVLITLTLLILGVGTLLAFLLPGVKEGALGAAWWTWNRVTNPGMLPEDKGTGILQVALSSVVILCGWIVFGLLISILTTAFQERLEKIKRGATEVLSAGHTIVLGWNSTVFSVIDQLGSDDEGLYGEVVVLADLEVEKMREEAQKYCRPESLRNVDFRSGSIASVKNIQNIKVEDARQVIILGNDTVLDGEGAVDAALEDSSVLKALLACYQAVSTDAASGDGQKLAIVASVKSADSARTIENGVPKSVGERLTVHVVHTTDLLSRLTAQSANQPSLARVYNELLSYGGSLVDGVDISSELYLADVDRRMHGLTLDECLLGYDRAIPLGYANASGLVVNPQPGSDEATYRLAEGDRIIAVADNREDVVWSERRDLPAQTFTPSDSVVAARNVLVVGEGAKPRKILEYLPGFLPAGSRISATQSTDGIDPGRCSFRELGSPGGRSGEGGADAPVGDPELGTYDTIVLADDIADPDRHDAKVLMDLTGIHASARGREIKASVIVELLDYRNVVLAGAFGDMAAIVSSELVSNFLVQLAVEPARGEVFRELLDPEGSEIYVRPVERYVTGAGEKVPFTDIIARARSLGEIAIGYIPPGGAPIQLCPRDRTSARSSADYGEIVVIAED